MSEIIKTETFSTPPKKLIELYEIVNQKIKHKSQNYKKENCITDYSLCYTITTINDIPYLGSVAWKRPFYNGMIRVLTRYCVNPIYTWKRTNRPYPRIDMIEQLKQQIIFLKKLGYNDFFISKEDKSNGKNAELIKNFLNLNTKYTWKLSADKQLVCPDPNSSSCWQYVIYNNKEYIRKCM